jgi:D-alanine--poly(phosphoribitol) ligase subunit 2
MSDPTLEFVYRVLTAFNQRMDDPAGHLDLAPGTALFGRGGKLDSLGLINLIVLTEETIEDEFGVSVALADERAMSQESSPFTSVASFAAYVRQRLDEARNG